MTIGYNNKTFHVLVAAFLVLAQAVFLLLTNISVFAQTAPTINFMNPPTAAVSGTITIQAVVSGEINGLPTIHFPGGYGSRDMSQNGDVYYFNLDTTDSRLLANQSVYLSAHYLIGTVNYSVESPYLHITINNTIIPSHNLTVNFLMPSTDNAILSGPTQIQVQTSEIDAHLILSLMTNDGTVINPSMEKTRDATGNIFTANLITTSLANSRYKLRAEATKEGYTSAVKEIYFYVNNYTAPTFLDLNFISSATTISDSADIMVETNQEATVSFKVYENGNYVSTHPSLNPANKRYNFYFDISNLENGIYRIEALIEKSGFSPVNKSIYITVNKPTVPPTEVTTNYYINFINKPTFVSGPVSISAQTNFSPDSIVFYVTGLKNKNYTGINTGSNNIYNFNWDINNFLVGAYQVKVVATKNGINYSDSINVNYTKEEYKNPAPATTTNENLTYKVTFLNPPASPVSGDKKISVGVDKNVDSAQFEIRKGSALIKKLLGIKTDNQHFYFNWLTREFPDDKYEIKAGIMVGGALKASSSISLEVKNIPVVNTPIEPAKINPVVTPPVEPVKNIPVVNAPAEPVKTTTTENNQPASNTETVTAPIKPAVPYLMPLCQEKGITENEKCQQFLAMPTVCRDKNITSQSECDQFLVTPQECRNKNLIGTDCDNYLSFPKECREANILNKEKCEDYTKQYYLPDSCRSAGLITQEECKNYIFTLNMPLPCREAQANSQSDCHKILQAEIADQEIKNDAQISGECLAQNINEADKCQIYLDEKYLALECRQDGVTDKDECDKLMFNKYGHQECLNSGINKESECKNYIFNKYSSQVTCENLPAWECMNTLQQNYLGAITAKQSGYEKIKEQTTSQEGVSAKAKDLFLGLDKTALVSPFKDSETVLKIINTEVKIFLDKQNNLIQTSPVALMVDSDEDGLPDDLEKRLGTDSGKKDSDGDGYSDGEEIKNGYNPLGDGKLIGVLSPVDEAIIKNKIFNQPKTEGQISEAFNIEKIINNGSSTAQKYLFNGQAEPNKVITLYIYSDLPIIATVQTDEFGNWQYELSQSLSEGEHEVYVAVNDNTGKILAKGSPLSFFIKEAKAVSVDDFLATAQVQSTKKSESSINYYLIISGIIIISGISMFVLFFVRYRKQENINQ